MEEKFDYVGLVRQAQLGDRDSLNRLAEVVRGCLRTDIYRLTLDAELTQEIIQECMLEMFKVLGDLKEAERFWPWLYKIALNKIRLYHRTERRQKSVPMSAIKDCDASQNSQEVMAEVVSGELKQIVVSAMQSLRARHRTVLTLRCYREMEYSAIAETMDCSEFAAKMLFYRAKKALKKQLSRRGFNKGSFLMALVLFGKLTAPSKAAAAGVSVSAAAVKVGLPVTLIAAAASKTTIVSLATAGALVVGTAVVSSEFGKEVSQPAANRTISADLSAQTEETDMEYWYYFPNGKNGPVISRLMNGTSQSKQYYCVEMHDDKANYYFDKDRNAVVMKNHRQWHRDLSVWRLPTDNPKLRDSLSQIQGVGYQMQYVSDEKKGLLIVAQLKKKNETVA